MDVTRDARYHGGYEVGRVYRLAQDVTITPLRAEHHLLPIGLVPGNYPTVAAGTRVRLKTMLLVGREIAPTYCVYGPEPIGAILDGPHARKTVHIAHMSADVESEVRRHGRKEVAGLCGPDPRYLLAD